MERNDSANAVTRHVLKMSQVAYGRSKYMPRPHRKDSASTAERAKAPGRFSALRPLRIHRALYVAPAFVAVVLLLPTVSMAQTTSPVAQCGGSSQAAPDPQITYCTQAIEDRVYSGKELAFAYNNRGVAYYMKQAFDRAIADFDKAIQLDPPNVQSLKNRALSYAAKNDHARAIADYTQALVLDPNDASAHASRAASYAASGDDERAIADYDNSIKLDPTNAAALTGRGLASYRRRQFDHAIDDFAAAIALAPNDASAFYNRASIYLIKQEQDRAILDFGEAIKLDPDGAARIQGSRRSIFREEGLRPGDRGLHHGAPARRE